MTVIVLSAVFLSKYAFTALAVCLGSLWYWKTPRRFPKWHNELKPICTFQHSWYHNFGQYLQHHWQKRSSTKGASNHCSPLMREEELERGGRIQYVRRRVPSCHCFRKVFDREWFYFSVSQWSTLLMPVKSYLKRKTALPIGKQPSYAEYLKKHMQLTGFKSRFQFG